MGTRHLFIAPDEVPRQNWLDAFGAVELKERVPAEIEADLVWLLLPEEGDVVGLLTQCRKSAGERPVITISDIPTDRQGLLALGNGAAGYCNGHSAPEVLQQVAATVLGGGLWVGQWLLQKLLLGVAQAAAGKFAKPAVSSWASGLTEREVEIARAVATGASNKEIAARFDITERTVKAHLGSIFDKLKLRDRLQLTLLVNGIARS